MSKKKQRKLAALAEEQLNQPQKGKKKASTKRPGFTFHWLVLLVLILPFLISEKISDSVTILRYIFLSGTLLVSVLYILWQKKAFDLPAPLLIKLIFASALLYGAWSIISMQGALNYREGYYEVARHFLNIILLIVVITAIIKDPSLITRICKALVWVALLQGLIGIFQYYDIAFTEVPGANEKPYGLMGNRNLFGSAQVFIAPFVFYMLYSGNKLWKYISGISLTIVSLSIFLSQTRSAWLAFVAVILVSLILTIIFSPANRKKWILGTVIGTLVIAAFISLFLAADIEGQLSQSVTSRAASLTGAVVSNSNASSTVTDRLQIWKQTGQLIKDNPALGVGPGNWKIAILQYGTEGLIWAYGNYSPDRVHNVYLQVTAETGIPGAIFYFGMWLLIAFAGFKTILRTKNEDQKILVILMLAGLSAVAVDAMFSFPTERIEHTLYMFLMGAFILGSYLDSLSGTNQKVWSFKKPVLIGFGVILAFNLFLGFKRYQFDRQLSITKAYENSRQYNEMLQEATAGMNNFITLGLEIGVSLELKAAIALKELKEYDKALKEISIAKKYNPYSANVYSTEGTIYTDMGQFDRAIQSYEKGLSIVPQHDIILKNLSVNYFNVENYKGCIDVLNKIQINGDEYLLNLLAEAKKRLATQAK